MNRLLFIVITVFTAIIFNQCTKGQQPVNFLAEGNLRTVFEQAKAENKSVLIEIYSPDCHVCKAFAPTFDLPEVGAYYNDKFVSYKVPIESEEAQGFLNKQKIWIPSIPTLLFFNNSIELQHIAVMSEDRNNAKILIDAATKSFDKVNKSTNLKQLYDSGNRKPEFLMEYGYMTRIQKDTLANAIVANEYFKTQKEAEYTSNINLLVLEKMIMDDENGLFKYMINNLPKYYAVKEKTKINSIAENIIMYSLYSGRGNMYSVAKINEVKQNLAKIGVDPKSIAGRVWMNEASAYFRVNKSVEAIKVIESRIKGATVGPKEYKYLCEFVKGKTTEKSALGYAEKWCILGK